MCEWHCTRDGTPYGPMADDAIKAWIAQEKVGRTDMVWKEGMSEWQQAGSVAELLESFSALSVAGPADGAAPVTDAAGDAPIDALAGLTEYARTSRKTHMRPHRGGTVLVLGILGLVVCCICGIIAWFMSNNDQREMSAGRMDSSGRNITQAGGLCGVVGVVLSIVGGILWFFIAIAR